MDGTDLRYLSTDCCSSGIWRDARILGEVRTERINVAALREGVYSQWAPICSALPKREGGNFTFGRVLGKETSRRPTLGHERYRLLWFIRIGRNIVFPVTKLSPRKRHGSMIAYRSLPSEVITRRAEPPSPHGCQSTLAICGEEPEAW